MFRVEGVECRVVLFRVQGSGKVDRRIPTSSCQILNGPMLRMKVHGHGKAGITSRVIHEVWQVAVAFYRQLERSSSQFYSSAAALMQSVRSATGLLDSGHKELGQIENWLLHPRMLHEHMYMYTCVYIYIAHDISRL